MSDALHERGGKLIVAREDEPGTEKGWVEPGIAQNRTRVRLYEDASMSDGSCSHGSVSHTFKLVSRAAVLERHRSRNRGVFVGHTGARNVVGPFRAIPVSILEAP